MGLSCSINALSAHELPTWQLVIVGAEFFFGVFTKPGRKKRRGRDCLEGGEGVLEVGDVLDELDRAAANEEVVVHHTCNLPSVIICTRKARKLSTRGGSDTPYLQAQYT